MGRFRVRKVHFQVALLASLAFFAVFGSSESDSERSSDKDSSNQSVRAMPWISLLLLHEEDPPTVCEELGLPSVPFVHASEDTALYASAADFTVETTAGPWNLLRTWSGCESYFVIQEEPNQVLPGFGYGIWEREEDVAELLDRSPMNVHFLFVPKEDCTEEISPGMETLMTNVDTALAAMTHQNREWWEERVHFVLTPIEGLDGWLGSIMTSPGWGVGIDRFQRIRYIGSYADPQRYDSSVYWFGPNLSMVANEALLFNFEYEREQELAAAGATVIQLFDGQVLGDPTYAGTKHYANVTLPDETAMAGFDTLELDMYLGCDGEGEYGTCPAWNRLVYLYLCDSEEPETCDQEIGRWVTPYHREGRWVHDISTLLPLLDSGGAHRFAYYSVDEWEVTLSLRLSNQGKDTRPSEIYDLFAGNVSFDEVYNDAFDEILLVMPMDAEEVRIASLMTGHGNATPGGCAEFCNTTHHFYVNGSGNVRDFPDAGSTYGCMDQVSEGTVPNQYGTWWYGRSGWCPGREVSMVTMDVTGDVLPGWTNAFDYEGFYQGAPYSGTGGCSINLRSWLVIYR